MTLTIKTGMAVEQKLAQHYASSNTLVLTGALTVEQLDAAVPSTCTAILSMGVCGGLSPDLTIGKVCLYESVIVSESELYQADAAWRARLVASVEDAYQGACYSTGAPNIADTPEQRAGLYSKFGCQIIDDETYAVAQFASKRSIPWMGFRAVSDGAEDKLPPAVVNAINPDGSDNVEAVLKSVLSDPFQVFPLVKTAYELQRALMGLRMACIRIGSNFQWSE